MNSRQYNKTKKLNNSDYKNILKFYKIDPATLSNKEIKEKAEHFLAVKLCKCIKNIKNARYSQSQSQSQSQKEKKEKKSEKRAIAICYNSVLKKKNLKIFKFNCKKTVKLLPKKGTRKIVVEKLH
jgi:hypothetical protein